MPSLHYHVEAPGVNILKTVSDEVVHGLLLELGLADTFKDSVYTMSSFMASSQYKNSLNDPTLNKNRCDVEISYAMDPSQVPWPEESPYTTPAYGVRATHKGSHTPLLVDAQAGILIEHHTVACALDMSFRLTFTTFDLACRAFDTIRTRYKGTLLSTPFDLVFAYPVNMGLMQYLHAVYKCRTGYQTKTMFDYINDFKFAQIGFDVRRSQLIMPDADKQLMIRCQQLNCVGQLTFDQKEPDVELVNNLPVSYSLSFTFQLQFGRPNRVIVNTPVSVDNTLLPPEFFQSVTAQSHYSPLVSGIYQNAICSEFMRRSYGNYGWAHQILRTPVYDDWWDVDDEYGYFKYRPFFVGHLILDGQTTVIDLKNLGDISIHPVVQSIMKEVGNDIFGYGGLFTLGVYAGNLRLGPNLVSIDEDLNLTIISNRPDQVYHLVLSETTNLFVMDKKWDPVLIKYRYFFPLTIERNLQALIARKYFHIGYENTLLYTISRLFETGKMKAILATMIELGEDTSEIYNYTQNPSQIADYMALTPSQRDDYVVPTGDDSISLLVQQFYQSYASAGSRSLLIAFLEQCLIGGVFTLATLPEQYITPSSTTYPYYNGQGGYYAFNTPIRIFNTTFESELPTK